MPVALLGWAAPAFLGEGYLPAMYVIGLVPLLAVAAAAGATHAWRALSTALDGVQRHRPELLGARARTAATAVLGVAAVAGTAVVLAPEVRERSLPLATAQANQDWRDAVAWVRANVPASDDVVVPFSAWDAVQDQGRGGPWNVVAIEKVDLDTAFPAAHPGGWQDLEWILEGPSVDPMIDDLGLTQMRQAMDSSRVVASFGDWNVREIVPPTNSSATPTTSVTTDPQEQQP
ncbi:hypothetical protein [Litorihabitans aurantiacus]|uniref:hypothetical protein n=1 Tax=Litorihabitans aurantiacus TaxID=1930061 RepID=UPI0024E0601C|nr:hypothetical protein [Litorihabitans aurantiacus]